jgi:hypothetical protein
MFAPNVAKGVISSMLAATFRSAAARAMLIADCEKDIVSLEYTLNHWRPFGELSSFNEKVKQTEMEWLTR